MSRLSREKKREQKRAARSAPAASPFEVRVPVDGPGAGGASIGGVPVTVPPGEEIQQVVLTHLHRIATATGHPVHATIHDDRIGYVVPLQIDLDGSTHFTAEPRATGGAAGVGEIAAAPSGTGAPAGFPPPQPALPPALPPASAPAGVVAAERHPEPEREPEDRLPGGDPATHRLRAVPVQEPEGGAAGPVVPTFPLRAVPESAGETAPTFPLPAVPEPAQTGTPLGSVRPPTGQFGPPPSMDGPPRALPALPPVADAPPVAAERLPFTAERAPQPAPAPIPDLVLTAPEPDPKPTPARGFDAVAEAVLGDDPMVTAGEGVAFLAEPMALINEAVKAGRIEEAASLAERTVDEAADALGPDHLEVLRLRELTSYIAYLAGDPVRSFHLSLDLAGIRHRAHDAEGAYGNVQSAATAWRAVRDPGQGLSLGRALIDLWTELTTEDGPAVDDIEQLESARARMGRLTERARRAAD
ncbi:tetratricopeptide repeat protein [Streptomyces sp. NBC_01622]|uniref:tetratricopeptide repeat protein n=1 Tax=Streptomyces sp. NBC_01622 TaxID=2975903 RepID=UPI0038657F3B|nr:tetratricopeptide repeat protein [Streptomyces sp. NBC_01622]